MLSKKAARIGRLRLRLRSAAALGLAGEGIGRMRLRPAIAVVPRRRRGKGQRSAPVLPDDALVEILSRVPARSLCRFKCVSKAWRDLIAGRLRCTKLPQTLEGFFYALEIRGDGNSDNGGGVSPSRVFNGRFINTSGRSAPLASYSFLADQPGIDEFGLFDSCNGLLLFSHRRAGDTYNSLGYIVCNPATEQWVAVPSSGWKPGDLYLLELEESEEEDYYFSGDGNEKFVFLIFDPAVSSHFQVIEFWTDDVDVPTVEEVHTYSSQTGLWCKRTGEWSDEPVSFAKGGAFVSGMLHFAGWKIKQDLIVAVDGEGKNRRIINGPEKDADIAFLSESQGRLQCINQHIDYTCELAELSVWVLQDYDREEWVLKHTVTFLQMFGRGCRARFEYTVVAVHPDRNLIYYFQHWDLKLKSYDMDSEEVCTLCTLGGGVDGNHILPYVPYFAESPALATQHWNWPF